MKYLINEFFFEWRFSNLAAYTYCLPVLVALLSNGLPAASVRRHIVYFVTFAVLLEYFSTNRTLTADFFDKTNSPFYHVGTLILLGLLFAIYRQHLLVMAGKRVFWSLLTALWAVCTWNMIWGDGIMNFPSLSAGLYSLTGILLGISYLYRLMMTMEVARLEKDPLFLTTTGFLIYYSGNLLLWIFLTYFNTLSHQEFYSIYRVNGALTIFLNLMLTLAVLVNPVNKSST